MVGRHRPDRPVAPGPRPASRLRAVLTAGVPVVLTLSVLVAALLAGGLLGHGPLGGVAPADRRLDRAVPIPTFADRPTAEAPIAEGPTGLRSGGAVPPDGPERAAAGAASDAIFAAAVRVADERRAAEQERAAAEQERAAERAEQERAERQRAARDRSERTRRTPAPPAPVATPPPTPGAPPAEPVAPAQPTNPRPRTTDDPAGPPADPRRAAPSASPRSVAPTTSADQEPEPGLPPRRPGAGGGDVSPPSFPDTRNGR